MALSLSYPADDPRLPEALRRLKRQLPGGTVVWAGGAAVGGYRDVLDEIGARCPDSLPALRSELDQLRGRLP